MDDTLARLVKLEEQAAHQETGLQQLSDVLADQWQAIDRLTAEVGRLKERIGLLEDGAESGPVPPEPPPPHY